MESSSSSESIFEEREEVMISIDGESTPTLRTAHFLEPPGSVSTTSIDKPISELASLSQSLPPNFNSSDWPLKVSFNGWKYATESWIEWIDHLHSEYKSVWRKAGIYEALMNSKFHIVRNDEIMFAIAEKVCPETNTLIFPWAEVAITLEDVMVLGGYCVSGYSVLHPLVNRELKNIEDQLMEARVEAGRSKSRKASQSVWQKMFMKSGREIEHEAFLVMWLSKFVFPESKLIRKLIFPIAIHLAKGTKFALAPAVLASIYRDLSYLKEAIASRGIGEKPLQLNLWSPIQLVQLWAWERFPGLMPIPNRIKCGAPVFARWDKVKSREIDCVRLVLDSAADSFEWRPYAKSVNNWVSSKCYAEKEVTLTINPSLNEELLSFARCLRGSQLVGLGFMENYFPHRVSLQFGMDQDLPVSVMFLNRCPTIAWKNYSKSLSGVRLYIPSKFFEADVTDRYFNWLKPINNAMRKRKRIPEKFKQEEQAASTRKNCYYNDIDFPPGFLHKFKEKECLRKSQDVSHNVDVLVKDKPADSELEHKPEMSDNEGESSGSVFDILGSELEDRVRKLEQQVVQIKAARRAAKFGRKY